jgi:large subunit ribosomal protein L6
MCIYTLNLFSQKNLTFCLLKKHKIFIYKSQNLLKKYFVLPNEIKIKKLKNILFFNSLFFDKDKIKIFVNFFIKYLKNLEKKFVRTIYLRGLGFRINFSQDFKNLILKLGYSNLINIKIKSFKLKLILKKKAIHVQSEDLSLIGNLCQKIKSARKINVYTGKGFRFKHDVFFFKSFKKK